MPAKGAARCERTGGASFPNLHFDRRTISPGPGRLATTQWTQDGPRRPQAGGAITVSEKKQATPVRRPVLYWWWSGSLLKQACGACIPELSVGPAVFALVTEMITHGTSAGAVWPAVFAFVADMCPGGTRQCNFDRGGNSARRDGECDQASSEKRPSVQDKRFAWHDYLHLVLVEHPGRAARWDAMWTFTPCPSVIPPRSDVRGICERLLAFTFSSPAINGPLAQVQPRWLPPVRKPCTMGRAAWISLEGIASW